MKKFYVYLLMLQKDRTVVANVRMWGFDTYEAAEKEAHTAKEYLQDFGDHSPTYCRIADAVEEAHGSKLKKVIGVYTAQGACMMNIKV